MAGYREQTLVGAPRITRPFPVGLWTEVLLPWGAETGGDFFVAYTGLLNSQRVQPGLSGPCRRANSIRPGGHPIRDRRTVTLEVLVGPGFPVRACAPRGECEEEAQTESEQW